MLNTAFQSILSSSTATTIEISEVFLCTLVSLILGAVIAFLYTFKNSSSKSFVITLALLPTIVQLVIMLVNGNLGTGVAVMGAFSLVRFRSAPGSAKEICSIFLAMAVGLATGMGYLLIAAMFVLLIGGINVIYTISPFGDGIGKEKNLKITIPEALDYTGIFDDIFKKYTTKSKLLDVKTTNMGSLFRLNYIICLKNLNEEKKLIDELRCRNGNLEIACGHASGNCDEL